MENFKVFPEIETERLRMREITEDDLEWYHRHFSIPEIVEGVGCLGPATLEDAKEELEKYITDLFRTGQGFRWGITLKGGDELIGSCGFYKWERDMKEFANRAEIGYDLDPRYWHQGIMREALSGMIDFGFDRMALHRIEVLIIPENTRSVRLIEGLGFKLEGVLREHGIFNGRFVDDAIYSLLKDEWLLHRKSR